jgi:sugar diacid utilization regulator
VIGVITLHAEAPHEFTRADLEFLERSASLVAGAVENARLFEEAQARIGLLSELSRLSQEIAAASGLSELLRTIVHGTRKVLGAVRCEIYLLDGDRLVLRAATPERIGGAPVGARRLWLGILSPEDGASGDARRLAQQLWGGDVSGTPLFAPLVAGEEEIGILAVLAEEWAPDARSALGTIAAHAAVAISQQRLIEQLRETTLVKDFLDALSRGDAQPEALARQAARVGFDLEAPYVAIHVVPWEPRQGPGRAARGGRHPVARPWHECAATVESQLAGSHPGALFDRREVWVRGVVPVGSSDAASVVQAAREALARAGAERACVSVGISEVYPGRSMRFAFEEALSAAEVGALMRGGGGVSSFEDLGPYRYLVLGQDEGTDRRQQALSALVAYDARRGTRLLETLEAYLDRRGNLTATARALYLHPNTLRQRLGRIRRLTGIDPAYDDWLSLAIALKLVRLRQMRGTVREERERGRADGRTADG